MTTRTEQPDRNNDFDVFRRRVETALDIWLPATSSPPERLHEAMRYVALAVGKRVRPILTYATGMALGVDLAELDGPACALELIHAYSLVHDDLPAMDDDNLRRGRPTCHRAFDEATAILVGDALQVLAFEILAGDPRMRVSPSNRLRMVRELARASGTAGMAGGQAIDLAATGQTLDIAALEQMHRMKTGALIRASVMLAILSAPLVDTAHRQALLDYADCVGLAFQIKDDILDVEGETEDLGKQAGADQQHHKATYVSILGLETAWQRARQLHRRALAALEDFDEAAHPLRELAGYIVARGN